MNKSHRIVTGLALTATGAVAAGLAVSGTAASAQPTTARPAAAAQHREWPSSEAANKALVLRFLQDVLNGHHGDHAARYLTDDAQFHAGTVGDITGRDNFAGLLTTVVTAIPDLDAALQDIRADGDEVVVRVVVTGTQKGDLLGVPASGRHVRWDAIDLYRIEHGKISQEWAAEDFTAFLNDTGTYKAPWIQ
ncbi:MAG TPA: ester cyclase [Mycobacterium sp.]|nr:ester cyclase [Mycobacterium sp.]